MKQVADERAAVARVTAPGITRVFRVLERLRHRCVGLRVIGDNPACGAVDGDCAAVRDDPLRACVTEWNADTYDGVRVVPADELNDDVTLLRTQPSTFLGSRTAGEVIPEVAMVGGVHPRTMRIGRCARDDAGRSVVLVSPS